MINVRVAKEQERTLINRSYPFQLILLYTSLTDPLIFFSDDRESLCERPILHDDLAEPFHKGP